MECADASCRRSSSRENGRTATDSPTTARKCSRRYYEEDKGAYQRRRYQYQAAPGGIIVDFTPTQREARFAIWGAHCWMCGIADATEEDHVKPISKGGSHCLSNLRPICKRCNTTKRGAWPLPPESISANFRHPSPREGSARDEVTERQPRVYWTCPQYRWTDLIRACDARNRKHCSRECSRAARAGGTVDRIYQNSLCAKTYTLPDQKWKQNRKFCSIECAWLARDRSAHWKGVSEGQLTLF